MGAILIRELESIPAATVKQEWRPRAEASILRPYSVAFPHNDAGVRQNDTLSYFHRAKIKKGSGVLGGSGALSSKGDTRFLCALEIQPCWWGRVAAEIVFKVCP